jgi:hypothetical protein
MGISRTAVGALTALGLLAGAAGCAAHASTATAGPVTTTTAGAVASPSPSPAPGAPSPAPGAGDSGATSSPPQTGLQFGAVAALVAKKPGWLGVEVRDRRTGAVWRTGAVDHQYWTGSTIKLAMITSVLERARAGEVTLTATDHRYIADMLAFSSDTAADEIWKKFGRDAMVARFTSRYGMAHLSFVPGFSRYWGFLKCTPTDMANLVSYVLTKLDPADRAYLVNAMRHTDPIQHWGVWAAGAAQQPGNKNGWSVERDAGRDHWLTSSIGFAGPDERYVLALMYDMPPGQDSLKLGAQTVSDIAATLFGASTPAPVVIRPS